MASLSPSLATIRDELDAASAQLRALAQAASDDAWRTRPDAGHWCVGECVQHLNMTSHAYLPILTVALLEARTNGATAARDSNRLDFVGWLLWKSCGPPKRRLIKMKTADSFVPASIEPKAKVLAEFEEYQARLLALLANANGLALSKIKVQSPFKSSVRYNIYSAFRIIAAHERRHLWQAERARDAVRAAAR
jgi:hypothetical protein